jgi:hypothetical protein
MLHEPKNVDVPRKKMGRPYAGGPNPRLAARAPKSLIRAVQAVADERRKAFSVIVREALETYLDGVRQDGQPAPREREAA